MNYLTLFIILATLLTVAFSIPTGAVVPCGAPKAGDSTSLICKNTMVLTSAGSNGAVVQVATVRSYCQTPSLVPELVSAYNAATTNSWTWYYNSGSNQNAISQLCFFNTSFNIFNMSCRSYRELDLQVDYPLPGFKVFIQNNTVVYGGSGTTLDSSYSVQSLSGSFSDYCNLQTDVSLPSSHQMPAGCVTIYSNTAAFNICQSGFMESMPSCDLSGNTKSSTKYSTSVIPGFNLCYSSAGVTPFVPYTITTKTSGSTNGVYLEGNGNFAVGQAESSHPSKQYVYFSISPAVRLESFLSLLF